MVRLKIFGFAFLAVLLMSCAHQAQAAQISVGIRIGPAPACPYGYFDYAPYNCAPYGYYGPDWFVDDIFIGAGPWFHGPHEFYGHVDNRYDPRRGYRGPLPQRGDRPFFHFQGNEARDGRGHAGQAPHEASQERALPGYRGDNRGGHHDDHGDDHR